MYPLDEPYVGKKELKYLSQAINSGWISSHGKFVKKFEKKFASYIGTKYAISCTSGTSALLLMWETLGLNPGDEIIMPSFTADGFALKMSGAKIIFADCEPNSFCIDIEDIKKKLQKKLK